MDGQLPHLVGYQIIDDLQIHRFWSKRKGLLDRIGKARRAFKIETWT